MAAHKTQAAVIAKERSEIVIRLYLPRLQQIAQTNTVELYGSTRSVPESIDRRRRHQSTSSSSFSAFLGFFAIGLVLVAVLEAGRANVAPTRSLGRAQTAPHAQ